jgi:hypothetical protein
MTNRKQENDAPKNPFVHRMIPTVTAVGLTLGAGACGGSDEPEGWDFDERPEDTIRDYCADRRSCVGEDNFEFDSVDACVSQVEADMRYYLDMAEERAGQECVDATSDVFDCLLTEAICEMGQFYYTDDACQHAYNAYYAACYGDMSGSM